MLKIKLLCILRKRHDMSLEDQAEECCQGGADAILLRGDTLSPKEMVSAGLKIRELTRAHKALFIVGERPDIAVAVDADGVNLGPEDLSIDIVKQIIGPRKIVGSEVSSLGAAITAVNEGAGYLLIGPMFSQEKEALGLDIIRLIKKRVNVPVLVFGAINSDNVSQVIEAGADGVAVSRAVCGASMVKSAAQKLKSIILELNINNGRTGTVGK